MDNTVHERICSRAADALSLAMSGPAVVVLAWSRGRPGRGRGTVRPTLICPDSVLEPTAAPPLPAPRAGKHPHQAQ
jgi:hypothetical protein